MIINLFADTGLTNDEEGASSNTGMGMSMLTGSAIMNLTLILPSIITFGSYNLVDDDDDNDSLSEDEPSFFTKLTSTIFFRSHTRYR